MGRIVTKIVLFAGGFFLALGLVLAFFILIAFAAALLLLRNFTGMEDDESPPFISSLGPLTPVQPKNVVDIGEYRARMRKAS